MNTLGKSDAAADDPLVESLLEEILGNVRPPDLKAQILARLAASTSHPHPHPEADAEGEPLPLDPSASRCANEPTPPKAPTQPKPPTPPTATAPTLVPTSSVPSIGPLHVADDRGLSISQREQLRRQQRQQVRRRWVFWLSVVPCVMIGLVGVTRWIGPWWRPPVANHTQNLQERRERLARERLARNRAEYLREMAQNGPATSPTPAPTDASPSPEARTPGNTGEAPTGASQLATSGANSASSPSGESVTAGPHETGSATTTPADTAVSQVQPMDWTDLLARSQTPWSDAEGVAAINQALRHAWTISHVEPAPTIDDRVWLHRVSERLLGRSPSPAELRDWQRSTAEDKRAQWVEHLLTHPARRREFEQAWATRFAQIWAPDAPRALKGLLEQYWARGLAQDQSVAQLVEGLVTAAGSTAIGEADFNDASAGLLAWWTPDGSRIATELCRVTLGRRSGCAQCHHDQLSAMSQDQFWQIAAVFAPLEAVSMGSGRQRLVNCPESAPSTGGSLASASGATSRFQRADGSTVEVGPGLWTGERLTTDETADRRDAAIRRQFAEHLTRSPEFARAQVNRVWGELLSYGFTLPTDDMGPHNPPAHPELLEILANQWRAHNADARTIIRWIVLSDAFARQSTIQVTNARDFPDGGSDALFSRFYERVPRLFANSEQAVRWLGEGRVPTILQSTPENRAELDRARLVGSVAPREGGPVRLDSPLVAAGQLLPPMHLRVAQSLAASPMSPQQQVEHVFRFVLSRDPSAEELAQGQQALERAGEHPITGIERLMWALLNSR